jgi:spermidine synthase
LDLTDPIGPSKALYTRAFYRQLSNLLNKNGILQLHIELCITRPQISKNIYNNLAVVFKYTKPSINYIPLYGGLMAFCTNSNSIDASLIKASVINRRLKERGVKNLKLYNGGWHEAVFKLPNFLQKLYDQK